MKKIFAILVVSFMFCSNLFAAAATVTVTDYGYSISGGTDATAVASGESVIVKALIFFPNTSTDKAAITTGSASVSFPTMTNASEVIFLGDNGIRFSNIKVTLTASTDILAIVTK